jgi:hypothetical protein
VGYKAVERIYCLDNAGKISHELAKEFAEKEFDKYYKKMHQAPSKADADFEAFSGKIKKFVGKGKKKKQHQKNYQNYFRTKKIKNFICWNREMDGSSKAA